MLIRLRKLALLSTEMDSEQYILGGHGQFTAKGTGSWMINKKRDPSSDNFPNTPLYQFHLGRHIQHHPLRISEHPKCDIAE